MKIPARTPLTEGTLTIHHHPLLVVGPFSVLHGISTPHGMGSRPDTALLPCRLTSRRAHVVPHVLPVFVRCLRARLSCLVVISQADDGPMALSTQYKGTVLSELKGSSSDLGFFPLLTGSRSRALPRTCTKTHTACCLMRHRSLFHQLVRTRGEINEQLLPAGVLV